MSHNIPDHYIPDGHQHIGMCEVCGDREPIEANFYLTCAECVPDTLCGFRMPLELRQYDTIRAWVADGSPGLDRANRGVEL